MKNKYLMVFGFMLLFTACKEKSTYVKVTTSMGDMVFRLYDETPNHRDNFVKLVEEEYYKNLLFHRVMDNFMIQGGDPNSRDAKKGQLLGDGGPGYTIEAEMIDSLFHRKGALAAAREPDFANPEKASAASQFYIVEGKTYTDDELDFMETRVGRDIPDYQRMVYKELGGYPSLDMNYTVFGEIVKGMDVLTAIASVQTDGNNRPLDNVVMNIEIVKWNARKSQAR